jgi:hypothetical protein
MQIDDNLVNLGLGMAVTVEIMTGERTVLSYLLSPIMRYSTTRAERAPCLHDRRVGRYTAATSSIRTSAS